MSKKFVKNISILIQLILFSISTDFLYTQLNVKTVLHQTIQFSVSTLFSCQKHFYFKQFSLVKQF